MKLRIFNGARFAVLATLALLTVAVLLNGPRAHAMQGPVGSTEAQAVGEAGIDGIGSLPKHAWLVTNVGGRVSVRQLSSGDQEMMAAPPSTGGQVAHCGPVTWHGIPVSRDIIQGALESDANFDVRVMAISLKFAHDYVPDTISGWIP